MSNQLDKISAQILLALARKALKGDAVAAKAFFELKEKLQPMTEQIPILQIQMVE
jgi:hypothetical protein